MKKNGYDVIGLGITPADYICLIDEYPAADEKTTAREFSRQGGGPVGTAMYALGTWGARAAAISLVGSDTDGEFVCDELRRAGVDTRFIRSVRGARTPRAFLWVDVNAGTRACVLDENGVPVIRPRDIVLRDLPDCRVFHTDGRSPDACIKAMRHYRNRGALVTIDAGSPRPRMDELMALTHHFVASHNLINRLYGPDIDPLEACRRILDAGPETAVVTLGEKGCAGICGDGVFRLRGHRRKDFIVDTTGAGDVFHAGYIHGLLKGWPVRRCAEFANAAAFLKCGRPGGREGIKSVRHISSFLKNS